MSTFSKHNVYTIGVAGGSGSGKSLIVDNIIESFSDKVSYIRLDNYYKRHDELSLEERKNLNYDEPDAFDVNLLQDHIKQIIAGNSVDAPLYDFVNHNRSDKTYRIQPKKVLLIEGVLALHFKSLRDLMDTKIYVDVDDDVRLLRRIKRDMESRGRSLDSVSAQYLNTVKPMYEQYVAPSKQFADLIVPQGGKNSIATGFIVDHISKFLNSPKESVVSKTSLLN